MSDGNADELTERYELLRGSSHVQEPGGGAARALLLQRGVAEWIQAWARSPGCATRGSVLPTAEPTSHAATDRDGDLLPESLRSPVTGVLSIMVLCCLEARLT